MGLVYKSFSNKFFELVDVEQDLQEIQHGFTFIEGPIWNKEKQTLIFNDIPESKTYKYDKKTGVALLRKNTHKANGNAYDREGNIIVCEHIRSCISRTDSEGRGLEVLVSHYKGKELNSPNDVIVKSDGTIIFTDPIFGRNPSRVGLQREQQLDFQGVFAYRPDTKELKLLKDDFQNPNGLCFSLDEKYLYVNDSPRKHIRKFKIEKDGSLSGGEVWAETIGEGKGLPDGMKIDSQENVFCCAQGGIHIFDKSAQYLGIVYIPEQTANFTFGGKYLDTLYITASTTLYSFKIKGHASLV